MSFCRHECRGWKILIYTRAEDDERRHVDVAEGVGRQATPVEFDRRLPQSREKIRELCRRPVGVDIFLRNGPAPPVRDRLAERNHPASHEHRRKRTARHGQVRRERDDARCLAKNTKAGLAGEDWPETKTTPFS